MSHLPTDRLAALADERPAPGESAHLALCETCAREVAAHRALLTMAASEHEASSLPLTRWDSLSQRLRAEGLLAGGGAGGGERTASGGLRATRFSAQALLRVAAALLLVAGGAMLGRASAGAAVVPGGLAGSGGNVGASASELPTSFASLEEARRWKQFYQGAYESVVSYLAANDTSVTLGSPAVMRTRLSALDRVSSTMREALSDAPYDPVINSMYLSSFDARETTLRQLNTVLPEGVRFNSF